MLIQIVEDDCALGEGMILALKEPGVTLIQNTTIQTAKNTFEENAADLVILDINLPDGTGYDYLKWIRSFSQIPVLILTANDMEMDEVMGLTLGADDYMTKPFRLAVLRARIKTLLRRQQRADETTYQEDDFHFDFARLVFTKCGREIQLSVNEQRLLKLLIFNKGRIMTRKLLTDRLWSDGGEFVDENALSVTINRLRSKLEEKKSPVSYIQTVYGQGYMWKREETYV